MARKKLDPAYVKQLVMEMRQATGEDRLETIDDIEEMAVQIGNRLAQELMVQELAERLEDAPERCSCPDCGQEAKRVADQERKLLTRRGEVEIKEAKYYCHKCRRSFFPSVHSSRP